MSVAIQAVHPLATSDNHNRVAEFGVSPRSFNDNPVVIRLPHICELSGDHSDHRTVTKFLQHEAGSISARNGTANIELLVAIQVIAKQSIMAYDTKFGVMASSDGQDVTVTAYLKDGVDVIELCSSIAKMITGDNVKAIATPIHDNSMHRRVQQMQLGS